MTFCNAFSNEQKRLSNAIAGCVFHLLLLLQLLFLLLLLLFAGPLVLVKWHLHLARGKAQLPQATEAARQQKQRGSKGGN